MSKKMIALTVVTMLLLAPMSASAVSWKDIADGLQTSDTFRDGDLTVTKDGDIYTFTGGEICREYEYDENGLYVECDEEEEAKWDIGSCFEDGGEFFFNGVFLSEINISAVDGKYSISLDKNTKAENVWMSTEGSGEVRLVNEGVIGDETIGVSISGNCHLTNKGKMDVGEIGSYDENDNVYTTYSNITAWIWDNAKDGTQDEAEKMVDRKFSFEAPGIYNVFVTLDWEDENGTEQEEDFIVTRMVGEDGQLMPMDASTENVVVTQTDGDPWEPMGEGAASWKDIADGLQTSDMFQNGDLTVTRDGDTYTFTGGKIFNGYKYDEYNYNIENYFEKGGRYIFNGVQVDNLYIDTSDGKYSIVLDKETEVGTIWVYAGRYGEIEIVNEGTVGDGEHASVMVYGNSHITNKGELKAGYLPMQDSDYEHTEGQEMPNISAYTSGFAENATQEEAEKCVDSKFSFEAPGTYNVIISLAWMSKDEAGHSKDFIVTRTVGADGQLVPVE